MDVCSSLSSRPLLAPPYSNHYQPITCHFQALNPISFKLRNNCNVTQIRRQLKGFKVKALTTDVSATSADPQVTWQIIIGALAGVTPFVVAGIEFSKRIVAQRRCEVCGGSGLVLRDKKYYFRCPNCGGFLPWQSWKRFFSG